MAVSAANIAVTAAKAAACAEHVIPANAGIHTNAWIPGRPCRGARNDGTRENYMNLQDTPARYGAVSVFNHWLGAVLIVALLAIGLYFEDMPRGDEELYWLRLHISIGAVALLPLAFRVFWRARSTSPAPLPQPPVQQKLARVLHIALLTAIAVLLVSGPLAVWSGGRAIDVFGWFAIASPLGEMPALHEALEKVHGLAAKVMLFSLAAHVLAALKHAAVNRDGTLWRIFGRAPALR
jgi:cytochrome b561